MENDEFWPSQNLNLSPNKSQKWQSLNDFDSLNKLSSFTESDWIGKLDAPTKFPCFVFFQQQVRRRCARCFQSLVS